VANFRTLADTAASEGDGTREILLRNRPERLEVSRAFAHLFKSS
jgi:hypothetical protein